MGDHKVSAKLNPSNSMQGEYANINALGHQLKRRSMQNAQHIAKGELKEIPILKHQGNKKNE